jgi:flagellar hook-associated protein 1 FlgK
MSLGTALNSAISGLQINQQQLDTISNNIANVGTPGYMRKILPQSTRVIEGKAIAVKSDTIIRKIDFSLVRDIFTQVSTTGYLDTKIRYLDQIQSFHGPPDQELSVAAEISALKDAFASLADNPEDGFALQATLDQAIDTANKINSFGDLLMQMRNDAQSELQVSVNRANDLITQIAKINEQIASNTNIGRTTATLEDKRDQAVKELAREMDISFFIRSDNVMVVQTASGVELAGSKAETIYYNPRPLSATNYLGDGQTAGIYTKGDPAEERQAIDITKQIEGGKIGALLELRDETLPTFMAQIDELAHKIALRFDAQGLRLFTDAGGDVPPDTPPDSSEDPPLPVEYVGFSQAIQVNQRILEDATMLRSGTINHDEPVQTGSNEVIRRVVDYAFTEIDYSQAQGDMDMRSDNPAAGYSYTLQEWLGMYSSNEVTGSRQLTSFVDPDGGGPLTPVDALINSADGLLDPANDEFTLRFYDNRVPTAGPEINDFTITVSMANAAGEAGANAAEQIAAEINQQINLAIAGPPPVAPLLGTAGTTPAASVGPNGEIVINTRGNLDVDAGGAGGMQQNGLSMLGLNEGTYETTDPYFEVQVGNHGREKVYIEPGDDQADLLDKLSLDADDDGVAGLGAYIDPATGFLRVRPGDDADPAGNPVFGGDLKLFGGPFVTDGSGEINTELGAGTLPGDVGIIQAIFGSFTDTGGIITNSSPVTEVGYGSETSQDISAGTTSGQFVSFRENYLGPNAEINTEILGSDSVVDFGQKMINRQSELVVLAEASMDDEETFLEILEGQLLDESGVNIDEEMSNMILIQNAFGASARAVQAINEMFDALLNAI